MRALQPSNGNSLPFPRLWHGTHTNPVPKKVILIFICHSLGFHVRWGNEAFKSQGASPSLETCPILSTAARSKVVRFVSKTQKAGKMSGLNWAQKQMLELQFHSPGAPYQVSAPEPRKIPYCPDNTGSPHWQDLIPCLQGFLLYLFRLDYVSKKKKHSFVQRSSSR